MIVKFAGNYHGHVDSLLVAAGSSAATLGVPNSPGVTAGTARDTLVLPYNDAAGLEDAFAEHGARIAGVILEPVVGNMGCVVPTPSSCTALRELTHEARGAADLRRGDDRLPRGLRRRARRCSAFTPDLTTLGKIVGGGLPVGAYGGRADIMDHILPAGKVFQAGTLSGNPLATAAGIATLQARCATTLRTHARTTLGARLAAGPGDAAAAGRRAAHDRPRRQHADAVLQSASR